MALVTVITPTYNRGYSLGRLFDSLQCQSSKNFEWLIVDDGSTDDTATRVREFIPLADFTVRYLRKANGGKHTALNYAMPYVDSVLTFIVDSDDTVLPKGIETIEHYYHKYCHEENIGVYAFLRTTISRGVVLRMPRDEYVGTYVGERVLRSRPGDMAEVFLTKALREFPFPEFPGEKFLSEDVVWIPLGFKYQTVFVNIPIYQFEYLPDGLTRNDKKHKFASPLGSMMRGKMLMRPECGWKANMKGAIIYNCYRQATTDEIPLSLLPICTRDKLLLRLFVPAGVWFSRKWRENANGDQMPGRRIQCPKLQQHLQK